MQRDLDGEIHPLYQYSQCSDIMIDDGCTDGTRQEFYEDLKENLDIDYEEVVMEVAENYSFASGVERVKYRYLDRNGETRRLEGWLARGANVFRYVDSETR